MRHRHRHRRRRSERRCRHARRRRALRSDAIVVAAVVVVVVVCASTRWRSATRLARASLLSIRAVVAWHWRRFAAIVDVYGRMCLQRDRDRTDDVVSRTLTKSGIAAYSETRVDCADIGVVATSDSLVVQACGFTSPLLRRACSAWTTFAFNINATMPSTSTATTINATITKSTIAQVGNGAFDSPTRNESRSVVAAPDVAVAVVATDVAGVVVVVVSWPEVDVGVDVMRCAVVVSLDAVVSALVLRTLVVVTPSTVGTVVVNLVVVGLVVVSLVVAVVYERCHVGDDARFRKTLAYRCCRQARARRRFRR
jgi:hypothetical protein